MTNEESTVLRELGERMASIETKVDEHNKRADEVKEIVMETQTYMHTSFGALKCGVHTERMQWHSKIIWALCVMVVGYGIFRGGMWAFGAIK